MSVIYTAVPATVDKKLLLAAILETLVVNNTEAWLRTPIMRSHIGIHTRAGGDTGRLTHGGITSYPSGVYVPFNQFLKALGIKKKLIGETK